MNQNRFRSDLRRGLGSCHLELETCPDIEAYREDVLWACRHAVAYDTQSEGTRAIYVYELTELFGNPSYFFPSLADGAKRDIKARGWRFAHEAEILVLMAQDGYAPARQALEELYELLLDALRTGRPCCSGVWPAADHFSYLCVSVLTNALASREEEEVFFLRVLADHGRLIKQRPALWVRFEDEWFEDVAAERFGRDRVTALLESAGDDPDIARYLENCDRLAAERRAYQEGMTDADREEMRARSLARQQARALARQEVESGVLHSLDTVYRPGGGAELTAAVKSLPVYEERGDWHEVFSDIRTLIEGNPEADRELSAALLPYIYRKGFCSHCRLETVELMAARGLLTPALLAECRHDCNMEIREYVGTL